MLKKKKEGSYVKIDFFLKKITRTYAMLLHIKFVVFTLLFYHLTSRCKVIAYRLGFVGSHPLSFLNRKA